MQNAYFEAYKKADPAYAARYLKDCLASVRKGIEDMNSREETPGKHRARALDHLTRSKTAFEAHDVEMGNYLYLSAQACAHHMPPAVKA